MPWTRRQVRYLLSSGSPLTAAQKTKMKGELHANPAMGHKKKGSAALKKSKPTRGFVEYGGYNFADHRPGRKAKV